SLGSTGGTGTFDVTAPSGCAWTVDPGPNWVSVTSGGTGNGNGTVNLSIAANSTTSSRSAGVQVGGQTFTVTEAGVPCSFSLSANNPGQPAAGGGGSVDISTAPGCTWTASSNAPWTTLGGNNGSGPATVNFNVGVNGTGQSRTSTLTIVGQTITVTQNGPVC